MIVTMHAAKTHLSKLIEAALRGEDVVIAKGDKPLVRLAPIAQSPFRIGLLAGRVPPGGPDFLAPAAEAELSAWEGEGL